MYIDLLVRWRPDLRWTSFALVFLLSGQVVVAQERAGQMSIDEIVVQPSLSSRESRGGEFSFGSSSFSLLWNFENRYRARLSLAGNSLRAVPRYYMSSDPTDEIDFYEAYGEYLGVYGRIRFGLLPINFGYGGALREAELIFPRNHLYSYRAIALRDFGLSFFTSHRGYYTEVVAHNGELDESADDGEVWVTSRWGYSNERNWAAQLSAQAGRTTKTSTVGGASGLGGFDQGDNALWRVGSAYFHWFPPKWNVVFESTVGERVQGKEDGRYSYQQVDVVHMVENFWGLGLRYEDFDPNADTHKDGFKASSAALITGSKQSISRLFFIYKNKEENRKPSHSDEFHIIWRLSPYF